MVVRQLAFASLVVGVLDILEVIVFFLFRGVGPMRVLQGVATGWFGRASFQGGVQTALIGLVTHFFIATVVVCVYHFASRGIAVLREKPVVVGALYGLGVYLVMNLLVVPMSNAGPPKFALVGVLNGLFAHLFCVGIPTGLLARART